MSALVHCDGPDCDQTRGQDSDVRAFCTPHWLHVEQDQARYDFHSRDCLTNWANGGVPRPTAVAKTVTCLGCDAPATHRVGVSDWCDRHGPFVSRREGEVES